MHYYAHYLQGGGFLASCDKETKETIQPIEKASDDAALAKQIETFRESLKSNHKSGEQMYFGDALFLLEASFNYYHGFTSNENVVYSKTDSLFIITEHNLSSILNINEISGLYTDINNALYENFENSELNNKKCLLFDFELEASDAGNRLILIQTIGEFVSTKSINAGLDPFTHEDYWHVGPNWGDLDVGATRPGRCGAYEGQMVGHDHTTRLVWSARAYYYSHKEASLKSALGAQTEVYYTDLVTIYVEDLTGLYSGPSDYCIPPSEMNLYHHEICEKIESVENRYSDKVFTGTSEIYNILFLGDPDYHTMLWAVTVGVKHTRPAEPVDLIPM